MQFDCGTEINEVMFVIGLITLNSFVYEHFILYQY